MAETPHVPNLRPIEEYIAAYKEREDILRAGRVGELYALWMRLNGRKQAFVDNVRLSSMGAPNALGEFSLSLIFLNSNGHAQLHSAGLVADNIWNPRPERGINCTLGGVILGSLHDGIFEKTEGAEGLVQVEATTTTVDLTTSALTTRELITV